MTQNGDDKDEVGPATMLLLAAVSGGQTEKFFGVKSIPPSMLDRIAQWKAQLDQVRADRLTTGTLDALSTADQLIAELAEALSLDRRFACMPEPGEPSFTLLARDAAAGALVEIWADIRAEFIRLSVKPRDDMAKVIDARAIAAQMREWRTANRPPTPPISVPA